MRINRAMAKIRTHLARVGIVVSLALLAELLEERAAHAFPTALLATGSESSTLTAPTRPVNNAVRHTARLLLLLALRGPICLTLGAVVLAGGVAVGYHLQAQRLSPAERMQLFTALSGSWTGTLDFADDRTKQRFTFPTTVVFDPQNGDGALRFTATYRGSDREDITTLTRDPRTGDFVADNGGPRSSHNLHSTGDLVKLGPEEFAFRGWSYPQNAEVRLRIRRTPTQASVYEEYRKQGEADYQFRNRFLLHR